VTVRGPIRALNETLVGYGYSHVSRSKTSLNSTYWTKVRFEVEGTWRSQVECSAVDTTVARGPSHGRGLAEVALLLGGYGS
jgi:hypothetical protein